MNELTNFNALVRETAQAINYERPIADIAAYLVQQTGSQEKAYLIYMAACMYLKFN